MKPEWMAKAEKLNDASKEKSKLKVKKDVRGYIVEDLDALGENAVAEALKIEVKHGEGYDMIYKNIKIDVVTHSSTNPVTLDQTGKLTPEEYNPRQNCDVYVFTRLNPDQTEVGIGGWISRDEFYKFAKFRPKGAKVGCIMAPDDGHRVRYRVLKSLSELGGGK